MSPFYDTLVRHFEAVLTLPLCLLTALIVHELGHYAAAHLTGLKVESVTFGRGRLLWSRKDRRGTLWQFHLWPLRAHVHIARFESPSVSFRKRFLVILAGPLANFLLPVLLFFCFFAVFGKPAIPTIVTAVEPNMPAYKAGVLPGDRILSINGEEVHSMEDILAFTQPRPKNPLRIAYERGGKISETSVLPVWYSYRDIDGVKQSHGRIGLSTWQQAYKLEVVRSVDGVPTPTEDRARAALLANMDKRIVVGLWSMDGKIYDSLMDISPESNRHLGDLNHRESARFFLGAMRDNLYLPLTVPESARAALKRTGTMLWNTVRLPFNLFPINKEWVTPDAVVSRETSYLQVRIYVYVFFASLCSCFIGFLNLVPFPRLDGGAALLLLGEAWKRRPLLNREKAAILVVGLLLFYAAIFGANMNDLRGYYLFQMQKASAAETSSD